MRRILVAAFGLLTAAGLSLGLVQGVANAAIVTGPTYTNDLAGYQVNGNGADGYNEVRGTVHVSPGSTSNAAIYLQENAFSGGLTAELALVKGGNGCLANQWGLEAGVGNNTSPGPLTLVSLTTPVPDHSCINAGGSEYLEVHYSTLLRQIVFVAGPNEFGDTNVLNNVQLTGLHIFHSPAVGVHYTVLPTLPTVSTPQMSFTRDGLTRLLNPSARRDGTNDRLNLASQSTLQVEATPSGAAPTVGNPVYLITSAFSSGGAFNVTAAP